MRRRRLLAGVGAGAAAALGGCSSGLFVGEHQLERRREELAGSHDAVVGMTTPENAFAPETLTVDAGDSVAWLNDSEWGHTVTAYEDGVPDEAAYFASGGYDAEAVARETWPDGDLAAGESYVHTFDVAGEYRYFCVPHEDEGMTGTVVVEE